jgi:hypothetical protein
LIMGVIGYIVKLSEFPFSSILPMIMRADVLTAILFLQSTSPSTTSSSVALKRFLTHGNCRMRAAVGTIGEEE